MRAAILALCIAWPDPIPSASPCEKYVCITHVRTIAIEVKR